MIALLGSTGVVIAILVLLLAVQVIQNQVMFRGVGETPQTAEAVMIGNEVALPTLRLLDGTPYSFPQDAGIRTLLIYFDPACRFCHGDVALWKLLHQRTAERKINVVAVTREDNVQAISGFVREYQLPFPIVIDPDRKLLGQLGRTGTPMKVLLGEDERIDFIWRGQTTRNSNSMALGALRMGFGVEPQQLPAAVTSTQ